MRGGAGGSEQGAEAAGAAQPSTQHVCENQNVASCRCICGLLGVYIGARLISPERYTPFIPSSAGAVVGLASAAFVGAG